MGVLIDNPLLLLFMVVGAGAALGSIRVRGISLGPAAALFVGLAASAADERLANTPAIVTQIGLALICFILPGILSWDFGLVLRNWGWIKENDLKLEL